MQWITSEWWIEKTSLKNALITVSIQAPLLPNHIHERKKIDTFCSNKTLNLIAPFEREKKIFHLTKNMTLVRIYPKE